jgi:23S rRNA pseudouridine1911/1915/1917 synthase
MKKLNIIYEDKEIIVINKEAGLLTIATEKDKEHNLYHYVREYLAKKNQKVFIVHRLDKDTSGLVLFAKSPSTQKIIQSNWSNVKRYYYAKVIGFPKKEDTLVNYLSQNKEYYTYVSDELNDKKAITKYKLIKQKGKYAILDIEILTGIKNQIRVQLNNVNLPILGDKKYGNNKANRMYLHAYKLVFKHPVNKKEMVLEIDIPKEF